MQHRTLCPPLVHVTTLTALALCGCVDSELATGPDGEPSNDVDPADPCAGVTCVDSLPYVGAGTTVGAAGRELSSYGCSDTVLDGAEALYRITVAEAGFLAAEVMADDAGAPLEVRLLEAHDSARCRDGDGARAGGLVEPGTYWVVVDSPAGGEGAFELRLGLTTTTDLTALGLQNGADDALRVFDTAWRRGDTRRFEYSIADFSQHSSVKRQWYVDLATEQLLYHLHVAHGRGDYTPYVNTGYAPAFSNVPGSRLSSFGVMRSAEIYTGTYGRSFRIDGLEPGINDNVRDRAIVMHPWLGSRPEHIASKGEAEPTWGCPAIDDRIAPEVAERFHDGVLMFFWFSDWAEQSTYLAADTDA